MLAFLTGLASRSCSLQKNAAEASGVIGLMTLCCRAMASRVSGAAKAATTALCSRLISAGGSLAGAITANQHCKPAGDVDLGEALPGAVLQALVEECHLVANAEVSAAGDHRWRLDLMSSTSVGVGALSVDTSVRS